jgi:CHASE3 domain sensor protein
MLSRDGFFGLFRHYLLKGHFRSAGTQILVVAIVLLVSGMVMFNASVGELERHHAQVQHTDDVLLRLAEADNGIIGVEFSVRGLALTSRREFTRFYGYSRQSLVKSETELYRLLAGDAEDMRLFDMLRKHLDRRLAQFDRLATEGTPAEVAQVIVQPEVRRTRFAAQGVVQTLRARMLQRLDAQERAAEQKARETNHQAIAIVGLAFLLAVLGLILARGESGHNTLATQAGESASPNGRV